MRIYSSQDYFFLFALCSQHSCLLPLLPSLYPPSSYSFFFVLLKISTLFFQIATHTYAPRYQDELALAVGLEVEVVKRPDGGWWYGRSRGLSGWLPSTHVKSKAHPTVRPREASANLYVRWRTKQGVEGLALPERESISVSFMKGKKRRLVCVLS